MSLWKAFRWQDAIGHDFKVTEHINIQELNAIEDEIRRRTENGEHDLRIVVCCDSRVVVGALAKGRTSSRSLSVSLRKLCVLCIAFGIQLRVLWVGTQSNPADHPSRHAVTPSQVLSPIGCNVFTTRSPRMLLFMVTRKVAQASPVSPRCPSPVAPGKANWSKEGEVAPAFCSGWQTFWGSSGNITQVAVVSRRL